MNSSRAVLIVAIIWFLLGTFYYPKWNKIGCEVTISWDASIQSREWDVWNFSQWIVQFYDGDKAIKTNLIRVQRLIPADQQPTHLFFDVKIPKAPFTKCTMTFWNGGSKHTLLMDNLRISAFRP